MEIGPRLWYNMIIRAKALFTERSIDVSEKRCDRKNRILRSGESQRKDGQYAYKYIDATGKPQFVYSWKPEATDSTPQVKRAGLSLQEKEKQIRRDIVDAIIPRGGKMAVLDFVKKHLS